MSKTLTITPNRSRKVLEGLGLEPSSERAPVKPRPSTQSGERLAMAMATVFTVLALFGLVMVLSASSVSSLHIYGGSPFSQFIRQAIWAGLGAVAFLVASFIDYRVLQRLAWPALLVSLLLLTVVLIPGLGRTTNGSTRWLDLGPIEIQPGEIAKIGFILFVADLLTRRRRRMDQQELTIKPVMVTLALLSVLFLAQPKLGTPMILSVVAMIMLFVAGSNLKSLALWGAAQVTAIFIAGLVSDHARARLIGFIDPWSDPLGLGQQAIQAQVGVASGGWFGVGLGASRAKQGFLPFAHTDFIFAVIAEEVGLVGATALVVAYLLIGWFGFKTGMQAADRFGCLLATGLTSLLLVQAFYNIGMVLGVLPITGEPLPFISLGGSSLVAAFASAGLLISVARYSEAK